NVNILVREINTHARTFFGAADLFAHTPVAELRELSFRFHSFVSHGFGRGQIQLLLNSLAFLALDVFAHITHAFAFIRFRRIERTQLGSHLADNLFVGAFNRDFGVFFHHHFDLVRNGIIDRVRIAEGHVHGLALHGGLETDALDFELLHETFADALDHVVDQRAAEAVQRFRLRVFALAADEHIAAFHLQAGMAGQVKLQLALRAFHRNFLAFDFHLDLRRNDYRLFSNSRHNKNSLPNVAEQFSAKIFLPGCIARHHAFRCRNHRHAEAAAHARNIGRTDIMAQAGPADAFDAFNHAL